MPIFVNPYNNSFYFWFEDIVANLSKHYSYEISFGIIYASYDTIEIASSMVEYYWEGK